MAQVWVPAGSILIGTDDTDPAGELAPPSWARFELAAERPQHDGTPSAAWWGVPCVARSAYRDFEDPPTQQDHHIGVRIVTPGDPPA
ncbi:MAG TPA: hypothetical protein VK867_02355 [Candidatus Limnocylindrales bacterium]|nr:hypothetical protein [Candidatus Limnocylindrales bacterium]